MLSTGESSLERQIGRVQVKWSNQVKSGKVLVPGIPQKPVVKAELDEKSRCRTHISD